MGQITARKPDNVLSRFKEDADEDFEDFALDTASAEEEVVPDADKLRQRLQAKATDVEEADDDFLNYQFEETGESSSLSSVPVFGSRKLMILLRSLSYRFSTEGNKRCSYSPLARNSGLHFANSSRGQ